MYQYAPYRAIHIKTDLCKIGQCIRWQVPGELDRFIAGYNIFNGKKQVNAHLIASETHAYSYDSKSVIPQKKLNLEPILGTPPACIAGGRFSDRFDGKLAKVCKQSIPLKGPSFSLKGSPDCLNLAVPDSQVFDSNAKLDNAPELLRPAPSGKPWSATTRVTRPGPARAPGGFQTGIVLAYHASLTNGFPTLDFWGFDRATSKDTVSLSVGTSDDNKVLATIPGVPKNVLLRIAYNPAKNCEYQFSYSYPGETVFQAAYSFQDCIKAPSVGLFSRTFTAPIAITTSFDWFDLKSA